MTEGDLKNVVPDWAWGMNCGVTVCDREGVILYMNRHALEIFKKHGDMRGKNLIPCHSERSRGIIRRMLETGESNSYTISKGGVRKMIYQTPWRTGDEISGLVEISMIIPENLPHYSRD